jgi:hypothetical protein
MAGTWIKLRTNIFTDARIASIARKLKTDNFGIIGRLCLLWSNADEHTRDGNIKSLTPEILDSWVGLDGFSEELVSLGWIAFNEHGATLPRFDEHNGQSAKRRAEDSARKAKTRTRNTGSRGAPLDGKSLADGVPKE